MLFFLFLYSRMKWLVGESEPIGVSGRSSKIAVISLVASCSLQLFECELLAVTRQDARVIGCF
jgi:hypothetical protein